MRRQYIFIMMSLVISLFIYLFYRTEKTLINEVLIWLISIEVYTHLKAIIAHEIPLNDIIVYSLPEGLWIFCITLTSKPYHFTIYGKFVDCLYVPLLFCFSLEILQLIHVTNGRFDWVDLGVSILFWLLARYCLSERKKKEHILTTLNPRKLICLVSYGIVYLAHVFK
jgi:hypothetical protein